MFKIFIKLMALLLVLALAGPFIIHGPDGRPLLSLQDLKLPHFNLSLPGKQSSSPQPLTGNSKKAWIRWSRDVNLSPTQLTPVQLAKLNLKAQDNIYYRWQDNQGTWQFSTLPNPNTLNFVVRTDPNANVLQNLSKEKIDEVFGRNSQKEDKKPAEAKDSSTGKEIATTLPIPTTIPVTEIPKLLQKAKDVQKLMNEHTKELNAMMQQ